MKKLASIIILSLLTATTAYADDSTCKGASKLAEVIMQSRQMGMPAETLIETAGGEPVAEKMVMAAFKEPRYETEEFQEKAVSEFKSLIYLDCLKKTK